MTESDEDRIRRRAYEIWEALGCPDGRHEDTWQQAQIEISAQDAYGLEADNVRAMQNAVVGEDSGPADTRVALALNPAPPRLQQLKDCVSD